MSRCLNCDEITRSAYVNVLNIYAYFFILMCCSVYALRIMLLLFLFSDFTQLFLTNPKKSVFLLNMHELKCSYGS